MNLLIDTCDALWFFTEDPRLEARKQDALRDSENIVFLSSVSAVEIAIKYSIGKLPLPEPPTNYVPKLRRSHHFSELPLVESASLLLADLPLLHRDPFDRQIICQAIAHDLTLLSSDPMIHQYPNVRLF